MSNKKTAKGGSKVTKETSGTTDQNPTLAEIMTELQEIKALLVGMTKNVSSGKLETDDQSSDEKAPVKTEEKFVETFTKRRNAQVYLSYIKKYNRQNQPQFEFYPGDSAKVYKRVFVESGTKLKVIPGSREVGDGERAGWKLDKNHFIPRMNGSATIPAGVDLFIEEKFIKNLNELNQS